MYDVDVVCWARNVWGYGVKWSIGSMLYKDFSKFLVNRGVRWVGKCISGVQTNLV